MLVSEQEVGLCTACDRQVKYIPEFQPEQGPTCDCCGKRLE